MDVLYVSKMVSQFDSKEPIIGQAWTMFAGEKKNQLDFSNWETGTAFNIQLFFKKDGETTRRLERHPSSVTVISTCDSGIFTVFLSFNGPTGMPKAWWKICPVKHPLVD